jgi:transposase-like protein
MKAKIMFEIDWWRNDNQELDISISSCGMVDGDPMPMDIYIKILFALSKLQKEHNEKHEAPTVILPTSVEIVDESTALQRIKDAAPSISPPQSPKTVVTTNKMRKAYTEDEKTEIAELYRDGRPVNEIASKFGRKPDSIYKLLSSMGVKRRKYEKPEVIAGSDASDPPKAKRECTLKKPWYLQRQTPNNRDKAKHE